MTKEALKLALKALEVATTPFARDRQEVLRAQAALREALAEQPAQQGCVRCNTPKKCALYGCSPLTWPSEQPAQQEPVKLRRGDILRCIETDELCTVWATSTSGKTLVKWGSNDFTNYTSEQIGELFWLEEKNT